MFCPEHDNLHEGVRNDFKEANMLDEFKMMKKSKTELWKAMEKKKILVDEADARAAAEDAATTAADSQASAEADGAATGTSVSRASSPSGSVTGRRPRGGGRRDSTSAFRSRFSMEDPFYEFWLKFL